MNHSLKNRAHDAHPGTVIVGKWHHCRYRIVRSLGRGANGDVFLADSPGGRVALKIGRESMSVTSEVNVLKKFSKVQGNVLGPSLIDVDDWMTGEGTYPFYVMEYLRGKPLLSFINQRGTEWIGILTVQLLADLDRLHRAGWAFGDLKPDNLLVVGPPPRVRWLDVGGTTVLGRSIKEYTEFFDRGYWGLGSRKAEPSYDLFAVAMIMINSAYSVRFDKKKDGRAQLMDAVKGSPSLNRYRRVITSALEGKYPDAPSMRKDMVRAMNTAETHSPVRTRSGTKKRPPKKQKKNREWTKTFLLAAFLFVVYFLYLFGVH
ncbi:MAG TPA: phosphotransferase [Bacillales bacterium]|nr:phosphotransferase [Bacillales bacterium]